MTVVEKAAAVIAVSLGVANFGVGAYEIFDSARTNNQEELGDGMLHILVGTAATTAGVAKGLDEDEERR